MAKNFAMILWPMSVKNMALHNTSQVLTHLDPMARQKTFNKFLKASIRKLCQADNAVWDQVLDQILFSYRCCPHTSTGEAPYTLLYFRDPPIPLHKLIQPMESYKGDNSLGKQIEQSRVTLSIAAKC